MVFVVTFCIISILWVLLSGLFDIFRLSLGVISCVLVTWTSRDLLFSGQKVEKRDVDID